jgi:hypothetical protein
MKRLCLATTRTYLGRWLACTQRRDVTLCTPVSNQSRARSRFEVRKAINPGHSVDLRYRCLRSKRSGGRDVSVTAYVGIATRCLAGTTALGRNHLQTRLIILQARLAIHYQSVVKHSLQNNYIEATL